MNEKITILDHPLAECALTTLRNKDTNAALFRENSYKLGLLLMAEALKRVDVNEQQIQTPLSPMTGVTIAEQICLVPILRSGLAILEPAQKLVPDATVGFIGLERDEHTAQARSYYQKMPNDLEKYHLFLLDPMLATGGSMTAALKSITNAGAKKITAVSVVVAPEGIEQLHGNFPDIHLVTAAIDNHLNDQSFIVPGLGDYGDRYFS